MDEQEEVRIDSFLWAVRLFKSRSMASDNCKKNRILINGAEVKPSRGVKVGDTLTVRKPPITYTYKVLKLARARMGAKLVPEYIQNLTPQAEYEQLELRRISGFIGRAKGTGRPTKRERRQLDSFTQATEGLDFFFNDDFYEEEEDDEMDNNLDSLFCNDNEE